MFIVSFCEQNNLYNLHRKNGKSFEHYIFSKDGENKITGAMPANPVNSVTIYGYLARLDPMVARTINIYYDEYFAVSEISDDVYEHLMAEWGTADILLNQRFIFGNKSQVEAIAEAKGRIAGGLASINTGTRPLSINEHYTKTHNLPTETAKAIQTGIY